MSVTSTIHFEIVSPKPGKTIFTERPRKGKYARGEKPLVYLYLHESGNMRMIHPDLWSAREIMARSESGQRAGAKPAVPNDPKTALKIATRHLVRYRGDGMDHTERQLAAMRKR